MDDAEVIRRGDAIYKIFSELPDGETKMGAMIYQGLRTGYVLGRKSVEEKYYSGLDNYFNGN